MEVNRRSSVYIHVVTELPNVVGDCCELLASFPPIDISTNIRVAYIEDDVETVEEHGGKESAKRDMTFEIITEWHLLKVSSLAFCCLAQSLKIPFL